MTGNSGTLNKPGSNPERWVLITDCSSGIGRALVHHCREAGWCVVATARQLSELDGLASGVDLYRKALDVTRPATIQDTLTGCSDLRLVALINYSGHGQVGLLESLRPEELRAELETNVVGLHTITSAFLPLIRNNAEKGEGRIIQVVSMLGRFSIPLAGTYSASKHAVVALTETLRLEIGREVKVVLVEHGSVRSRSSENLAGNWDDLPDRLKGRPRQQLLKKDSMNRPDGPSGRWSNDVEDCAARIVRALCARDPPRRVVVGRDAFWARRIKPVLPAWLWEWLLRRIYGQHSGGNE